MIAKKTSWKNGGDNWHKKTKEVYDMWIVFIAYDIDIHLDRMLEQTDKILEELKRNIDHKTM